MGQPPANEICQRIAQLRLETAGPRGKASFAKDLGLSPSTYDYYESSRVPPAEVLVRIAELTGSDLRWLLTGETGEQGGPGADHPVVRRAAALLADCPDAAKPLAAFLDILGAAARFPAKPAATAPAPEAGAAAPRNEAISSTGPPPDVAASAEPTGAWIPVLGRSAAGVACFWSGADDAAGVTTLDQLVARHAAAGARAARPATALEADAREASAVQIITLSAPDAHDVTEFVSAPAIKGRHGDAFALRIDGDSMSPDIRHGDLVIVSPAVGAVDGKPAVVQLEGQIGVTCKLFRRDGDVIHLVPVNDRYEIATFPAAELVWALRVLARVRG